VAEDGLEPAGTLAHPVLPRGDRADCIDDAPMEVAELVLGNGRGVRVRTDGAGVGDHPLETTSEIPRHADRDEGSAEKSGAEGVRQAPRSAEGIDHEGDQGGGENGKDDSLSESSHGEDGLGRLNPIGWRAVASRAPPV
jgi:hypothetical protein